MQESAGDGTGGEKKSDFRNKDEKKFLNCFHPVPHLKLSFTFS